MRRRYMNAYFKGFSDNMFLPIIGVSNSSYTAIIELRNDTSQADAKNYFNDDSFKLVYSSLSDDGIEPKVQINSSDSSFALLARLADISSNDYGVFIYEVDSTYGKFYIGLYKHSVNEVTKLLSDIGIHNTVIGIARINY